MVYRLVILGISVVVAGCFGQRSLNCEDVALYAGSDSVPPMRVPDGLSLPDEREALQIPPGEPFVPPDAETMTECLEQPPDFFDEEE